MAEDIWEKSKYKIKAYVVDDSKPYTGKVDLYYLKNKDESKPLKTEKDIAVKAGKPIERTYDVPEVDKKEATYNLTIVAKYGDAKEKVQELADATVWPKNVKIHVKNEDDDKDFKDVRLSVVQGGKAIAKPLTDKSGNCVVELTQKAAYTIESRSPYEIIKQEADADEIRKHEIVAVRRIVAMFVRPDVKKAPPWVANAGANNEANRLTGVRQYVNLTSKKSDGNDANGNVIEFEVCANPKNEGKKDDRVYLEVTFSKDSDRNDPKPELLNNPAVTDLSNAADPKVYTGYVKLEKDGGTAKFKVNTGLAGGDSCAVAIGGRKDKVDDETRTFVNWRKLWYELRYPTLLKTKLNKGDYAAALKTAITAKLGRGFVEFEKNKSHEFSNGNATFKKQNGMILKKTFLKDGAGEIYVVTNGWLDTSNKFSNDAKLRDRSVYVSLCERAFSSNLTEVTYDAVVKSDDFDIATPANQYIFEKRADTGVANLKVEAGFKWTAVITGPQLHATTWDETTVGGGAAGTVKIVDTRRTGKSVNVTFDAKDPGPGFETTLSAGETAKVDAFIADLLSSEPDLRDVGNQVTLQITGKNAGADDVTRLTAVRTAAKAKFDAVGKTIKYHPGLDRDGNPREGNMDVSWLSVKDYETIRVQLPKSPAGTKDYKKTMPGDFVGDPESDSVCHVKVKFSYAVGGEINGNSGGGEQIMVLRAAATSDALSETVCHELGHAMGMAVVPGLSNDLLPPGIATKHIDNGGFSYVNGPAPYPFTDGKRALHKGPHCALNVPGPKRAHERFDGWSPAGNGCIMWGSGDNVATRVDFCDECLKILKGRRLVNIRSPFPGRGADQG